MFKTFTAALISTIAAAQDDYFLEPFPHGGIDTNNDGTITLRAMQCEGGFTEVDGAYTEGTFFIGVASIEGANENDSGQNQNVLLGWGKDLCTTRTKDWTQDYTISFDVDATIAAVFDTSFGFTCQYEKSGDPQQYNTLKAQVNDNALMKAMK